MSDTSSLSDDDGQMDAMMTDGSEYTIQQQTGNDVNDPDFIPTTLDLSTEQIQDLQTQLQTNPYQYELHIQLVQGLATKARTDGDLTQVRVARETMLAYFPMTDELWKEWIYDELRFAFTPEEKKTILGLYERSFNDYLSIPLWKSYLDQITHLYNKAIEDGDEDEIVYSLSEIRTAFSKALQATSHHFSESHLVWNVIIDFEIKLLQASDSSIEQLERVRKLFRDRLATPHQQLEESFSKYSSFESKMASADTYEKLLSAMSKLVESTRKECYKREEFEMQLKTNAHSLSTYFSYIQYEKSYKPTSSKKGSNSHSSNSQDQPFRIRTLFERAVKQHCLDIRGWNAFIPFMVTHFKIPSILQSVVQRAIRNCPWSGDVWCHYGRVLEITTPQTEQPATVKAFFEQTCLAHPLFIASGMEEVIKVLLWYGEWSRRYAVGSKDEIIQEDITFIREQYAYLHTVFYQLYPETPDTYYRLTKQHLETEKLVNKSDMEYIRNQIFSPLLKSFGNRVDVWLEYIEFERTTGTASKVPSLFKQALSRSNLDDPNRLIQQYLDYEKTYGTVDSLYDAAERCGKVSLEALTKSYYQEQQYYVQQEQPQEQQQEQPKQERPKSPAKTKAEQEEPVQELQPYVKKSDRKKRAVADAFEGEDVGDESRKKLRAADEVAPVSTDSNDVEVEMEGVEKQPSSRPVSPKKEGEEGEEKGETIVIENSVADQMVCVVGLPLEVKLDDVMRIFQTCGVIDDIYEEGTDATHKNVFLQFTARTGVNKSLEKNGLKLLQQDSLKVIRCEHKFLKWQFKKTEDVKTVFVTGLHSDVKKFVLRRAFEKYGAIKDIRVTRRKNTSFAYVEFTEPAFAHASCAFSGSEIEPGVEVEVNISNPTKRKVVTQELREIYVSNLPLSMKKNEITKLFREFGNIAGIRTLTGPDQRFKGVAFVEFSDESTAKAAAEGKNGVEVDGRRIHVSVADPNIRKGKRVDQGPSQPPPSRKPYSQQQQQQQPQQKQKQQQSPLSRTIIVAGFGSEMTKDALSELFGVVGKMNSVQMGEDGTATIEYAEESLAKQAAETLNETAIGDNFLIVEKLSAPAVSEVVAVAEQEKPKVKTFAPRSFAPRATVRPTERLRVKAPVVTPSSSVAASSSASTSGMTETKDEPAGASSGGAGKSNADFRKLFLAGKK